ncbi:MAG: iron-sulfur cluster assembly protein [Candidatus Kapaibacterium sp.]
MAVISPQELEEKVIDKLKTVFDPEIPVNIYELGLVYDISITANDEVLLLMTLTAPNCPEADAIPREAEMAVKELPEVKDCKAILTFDPPWDKSRMSDAARLELGMF